MVSQYRTAYPAVHGLNRGPFFSLLGTGRWGEGRGETQREVAEGGRGRGEVETKELTPSKQ